MYVEIDYKDIALLTFSLIYCQRIEFLNQEMLRIHDVSDEVTS